MKTLFYLFCMFGSLATAATTLVHPKSNDPKETLVFQILQLAISKSGNAGRYQFESFNSALTEARMLTMLQEGSLDVMWAGTQIQYEQQLTPIRIPVLKGMLGHRIFIIRQGDQHKFNQVHSLQDLMQIPLGQGRFWGDTLVLRNANLNVVAPVKYESLFYMLDGGRFDFFPRALHEPWSEINSRPELDLEVENRILLIYPFAMYFFVAQDRQALAADIQNGFRRAIDDGSYDKLFFQHQMVKDALKQSNLKQRLVLRLENPNMSPETPIHDKSLWLNIDELSF